MYINTLWSKLVYVCVGRCMCVWGGVCVWEGVCVWGEVYMYVCVWGGDSFVLPGWLLPRAV